MRKKYLLFMSLFFIFAATAICRGESPKTDGEKYFEDEMYDEAIVEFKKAIKLNPKDADVYYKLGLALGENKMYERAVVEFKNAIVLTPDHYQAYEALGDTYNELDDFAGAEAAYKSAIKIRPQLARLYHKLAMVFMGKEKYPLAIEQCLRSLVLTPDNLEARNTLAEAYYYNNEMKKALSEFNFLKNNQPRNPEVLMWLGYIHLKQDEYDLAKPEFEALLKIKPADAWGHYYLATILEKEEASQNAVLEYKKALELAPAEKSFYFDYVGLCFKQGLYDDIITALTAAKNHKIGDYATFLLAMAYGAKGDMQKMFSELKNSGSYIWLMPVLVFGVLLGFLLIAGFIFLIVYLISTKKKEVPVLGVLPVNWGIKELFLITLLLFILPLVTGAIMGQVFYKNWFLIFIPTSNITTSSVSIMLLTQIITDCVLLLIIFKSLRTGFRQAANTLGVVPFKVLKSIMQAVLGAVVLMVFSMIYYNIYYKLTGTPVPDQQISEIIASITTMKQVIPMMILVTMFAPVAEEIVFRGFIYQGLRKYCGIGFAMLASSALFAMLHYQLSIFIPIMFMGLVFAWLYEKNKNIMPSIFAHLIWNSMSFIFIIFKV